MKQTTTHARHLLAVALAASLAACGGASTAGSDDPATPSADGAPDATSDGGEMEVGPGVTDDTITLGMLNDLTGPTVAIGEPLQAGVEAAINVLNEQGGVAGRQLELVVEDHAFNPQTAVQQYRGMRDEVLELVTVEGEPPTLAVQEQAEADEVFFWPGTFTSEYAASIYTPVATTYYHEALNAVDYIVNEMDGAGATIGAFVLESGIGRDYQRVWDDLESLYDVTAGPIVTHAAADTDYTGAVQQMIDAGVDYVLLGTAPTQAGAIMATASSRGLDVPAMLAAVAYSPDQLDSNAAEALLANGYVVSPWAAWDADEPGQVALREALGDGVTADPNLQTGWSMTQALAQVMEQAASDGDLTREGIVAALRNVGTISLEGVGPDISVNEGEGGEFVATRESRVYRITEDGLSLEKELFAGSGAQEAELDLGS